MSISRYNSIPVVKTVFSIQYSTMSLVGSQFNFLKCDESIWNLGGKFRQKRIHFFWAFWSLSFKFFFNPLSANPKNCRMPTNSLSVFDLFVKLALKGLKEETMRNIHSQNVAELGYCIIVFYTQELGTCFGNTGISFFSTFEAIAFPLNLKTSWQPRYSTVSYCLMEWPPKDILISLNLSPLKRKWI